MASPSASVELLDRPAIYPSTRAEGDVLLGDDAAAPLLDACANGDYTILRTMLDQPPLAALVLARPHRIYLDSRPGHVYARPIQNIETMLERAAGAGHADCVAMLVEWGVAHDIERSTLVNRDLVADAMAHFNVFKTLADLEPNVIRQPLHHGADVLSSAVLGNKHDLVSFLFSRGMTLAESDACRALRPGSPSLLYEAASECEPDMIDLLLQHGAPVLGSAALHHAAMYGRIENMEVLVRYKADVNERMTRNYVFQKRGGDDGVKWTPMQFAASEKEFEAVQWLREHGAEEMPDIEGHAPRDVTSQGRA